MLSLSTFRISTTTITRMSKEFITEKKKRRASQRDKSPLHRVARETSSQVIPLISPLDSTAPNSSSQAKGVADCVEGIVRAMMDPGDGRFGREKREDRGSCRYKSGMLYIEGGREVCEMKKKKNAMMVKQCKEE
jgi:hypothetical protein